MFGEVLRQALRNVAAHQRRSLLTLLTIAIGIFSVTAIHVFSFSMRESILERFEALGSSTVYVHHFPWTFEEEDWQKYQRRPRITLTDYQQVRQGLEGAAWVAIRADHQGEINFKGRTKTVRLIGISADFSRVYPMALEAGHLFTEGTLQRAALEAVVGARLARWLAGQEARAVGLTVLYKGHPLKIIGVLRLQGIFGGDLDNALLAPFPLLLRLEGWSKYRGDRTLLVRAKDPQALPLDELERRVRLLMRQSRHLPPKAEDNFAINRQDALLRQIREVLGYVEMAGLFLASFALLVGGFGVANILYIAVRERRGEIGIQRAIGAPRSFILGVFLTEGIFLCLAGGVVGLALTVIGAWFGAGPAKTLGLTLQVPLMGLLRSLGITLGVGLLAALAPAWQAARLHPIETIRTSV
ncbi:MAG: ABC transporter permease [Bacteroidia bacterium]|nr:ABC transporter permease [Bacteroidia bacterium]MDW8088196.1 ABC transporter permease [Bacteroidia bacterium]